MSSRLDCIVVGDQTLPIECSEVLLRLGHRVVGVVTSDPQFRRWAERHSIPCTDPDSDLVAFAGRSAFHCLFSIVNGRILPTELLALPSVCAVNFHDGPLPRYAGFNVTNWAILNGEPQHGITWHGMGSRLDAGSIYKQVLFDIAEGETALTLNAKCFETGLASFREMIEGLADGSLVPVPQNLEERTYIRRYDRPPGLCLLRFERPASDLEALSRALDFGVYPNPLGRPKFWDGTQLIAVSGAELTERQSVLPPGTIVSATPTSIEVSTATFDIVLSNPVRPCGAPWTPTNNLTRLPAMPAEAVDAVTALHSGAASHEPFWVRLLADAAPLPAVTTADPVFASVEVPLPAAWKDAGRIAGAFAACLARTENLPERFDLGFQDVRLLARYAQPPGAFATVVPLPVTAAPSDPVSAVQSRAAAAIAELTSHETFITDLFQRHPELAAIDVNSRALRFHAGIRIVDGSDSPCDLPAPGTALFLELATDAAVCRLVYNSSIITREEAETRRDRFVAVLEALAAHPDASLGSLPATGHAERERLLNIWNRTETEYASNSCIHHPFEEQAAERPDAMAVVFRRQQISYGELNDRANQLAAYLQTLGAGPGSIVAIFMDRSIDMVVALLATMKSGSAYVPVDPTLPAERISFLLADTAAPVVLTTQRLEAALPPTDAAVVRLDADSPRIALQPRGNRRAGVQADSHAYVIYTSGSTGQPKGVCITHRNVANFFAGMDHAIGGAEPGVWLAVTSISFDISVLELFWTLARGYKVVLVGEDDRMSVDGQAAPAAPAGLDFSLYYFASSHTAGDDKYRLFIEGVKYADEHDFAAVWSPERHFHAFGGLFPNPSVASAAAAAITKRVQIRAGSVVLPLHNPIRVAEEWSLVDNLSNGRVGISFASGWHARDFVLAPQNYSDAKGVMFREIETVRRLWRGEKVAFTDGKGAQSEISTLPRPRQAELPVWITAAANVETFRMAGARGYNLLTHLLGQRVETVAEKIAAYRAARAENGFDPAAGCVTLMLHTFVAGSREEARQAVQQPLKSYLASSVDLIRDSPWSFPAFTNKPGADDLKTFDLKTLSAEEMDALLEYAFDRYFETSGLFGTPDDCVQIAARLRDIGVNEIACLIDFGVNPEMVLSSLPLLNEVRARCSGAPAAEDYSLPAQIRAHGVTHLQCTPSMAKILVSAPDMREPLKRLKKLLIGGEALPEALARELRAATGGEIHNMYGPTETTVWSTTAKVGDGGISIGRPIANTTIYILDERLQPCPIGVAGELYIGGAGVSPGYYRRPQLTAQRFLADPFRPGERIYKTGDIARYLWDGSIEFIGRADYQLKIRGFRIELGEIETILGRCPGIRDAVVTAAGGDSEPTLAAYVVPTAGSRVNPDSLRDALKRSLPEYMIPSFFVELDALPTTHNGKVDRKALPAPESVRKPEPALQEHQLPSSELERMIASAWSEVLKRPVVSLDDNFFDLGGHSLLAVQVNHKLSAALQRDISLVEMFRSPTIRALARRLANDGSRETVADSSSRARMRREMLGNRLQSRARA